jgi:hypothetical protein
MFNLCETPEISVRILFFILYLQFMVFIAEYNSVMSNPNSTKRRIFDGTSERELMKAMSTYLNQTGAGDYNLPTLIGDKIAVSTKKTNPNWSFQSRTALAWFP